MKSQPRKRTVLCLLLAAALMLSAVVAGQSNADPGPGDPLTPELLEQAKGAGGEAEVVGPTADGGTWTGPTANLERPETVDLLRSVFGGYLEAAADPMPEVEVDHYIGTNAAVVSTQNGGSASGGTDGSGDRTLLETSIPLRVKNALGGLEPLDLSLEREGQDLEPSASLVPVALPEHLGEGIELPADGIAVDVPGAPEERSPSIVDRSAAVYPNIAPDTDFVASPTPTGVEASWVLRSAKAPRSERLHIELPAGAELVESGSEPGSAEIRHGSGTAVRIPAPTALDAEGKAVHVSMQVDGNDLLVTVQPSQQVSYPLMVDPVLESYDWYDYNASTGQDTWSYSSTTPLLRSGAETKRLFVQALSGSYSSVDHGGWNYYIPRYREEEAAGRALPTSYIAGMTLMHVEFEGGGGSYSPFLTAGILGAGHWAGAPGHEAVWGYGGNMAPIGSPGDEIKFENGTAGARDQTAKSAVAMGFGSTENTSIAAGRVAWVGGTAIELADEDQPKAANGSISPWIDKTNTSLSADAEDTGLGVKRVIFEVPAQGKLTTSSSCAGTVDSPCPSHFSAIRNAGSEGFNAAALPEGIDSVPITAEDVVGNRSPSGEKALLRVDHTAPSLALSGNLTEQATVGTKLSSYSLSYSSADGDEAAPVAQTPFTAPSSEPLGYPSSIVSDGKGHLWLTDNVNSKLFEFNEAGTLLKTVGSAGSTGGKFNNPGGVAIDPTGNIWVTDMHNNRIEGFKENGEFLIAIGKNVNKTKVETSGTSEAEKSVCTAASGNVCQAGSSETGLLGSSYAMSAPQGIAVSPGGQIWVTDTGHSRMLTFSATGAVLSNSLSHPLLGNTDLKEPEGVAIAPGGSIWVTDTGHNRIEGWDSNRNFIAQFGSLGSENSQFHMPVGLSFAPSGNLFVADRENNRVEEFKLDGTFMRSIGTLGSGSENLYAPDQVAFGPGNVAFIADPGNQRIAKWTHADKDLQSGVAKVVVKVDGKVAKEEAPGCATRNCTLSGSWTLDANNYSAGSHEVAVTATDGVGLSTTKTVNVSLNPAPPALSLSGTITEQATLGATRPRYVLQAEASPNDWGGEAWSPAFIAAFGATGSAEGQLNGPRGVASDGKGHVWVVDRANNRVEEFNESGEYLGQFGGSGSGDGKFNSPWGIAVTPAGNIWVTDTGNGRVQEFNSKGEFIQKFGTKTAGESKGTELREPEGIAVTPGGMLWVADCSGNRVAEFRESVTSESERWVRNATGTPYKAPVGVAVDVSGNVWVAEEGSNHLLEFGPEGTFTRSVGSFGSADGQLNTPAGVGVGPSGNVYVVDLGNNRVDVFSPEGKFLTKFGTAGTGNAQMNEPRAIGFGAGGAMFVSDKGNNRIHKWGAPWEGPPSFVSAFGATGSGEGQLNGPRGVAADGKGHVWVVDRANNRVEEFEEATGKYLGQFGGSGTGNGQFNSPWGIAVTSAGNIWVADTGNQRLQEFNAEGKFIQKFGTKAPAGSQGTELLEPEGIAATGNGMLWVSDCSGNRVAEFRETVSTESERFVRNAGGTTISAPVGVAVDGSGDVWVAEETANHLLEFDAEGSFVRSTGTTGSGNGQLSTPEGVGVGPSGDVYAVDLGNNRVDVFNRNGQFLTKFGTAGTGNGNFSEPRAIAFGASGAIFVSDKGNNRVHKWSQPVPPDQVAGIEVKVDGKAVGTAVLGCASSSCGLGREWVLNSPEYLGGHTVTVKATTVAGWTATKTLAVEEKRDEAKPTIQTGGELANAPEGWVQQEGYGFNATAADPGGYGATSLVFKIDGTQVASTTQSCREGGCEASLAKGVDMAPYAGGAHQAEVVATDGAGNSETKRWTLNVDPEGNISTAEATATIEAVEGTEPETFAVAPTPKVVSAGERAEGYDPGLEEVGAGEYTSTGTPVKSAIATEGEGSITVESPQGGIGISPVGSTNPAASEVVKEVADVSANTEAGADTVIRPTYNGLLVFQDIREPTSPEEYSWEVDLEPGETLKPFGDGLSAGVFFEEEIQMMLIDAMPAHDARGKAVSTSLSVSAPNIVTLTVEHRKESYVYPVTAGPAFEVGYSTVEIVPPPSSAEEEEEEYGPGEVKVSAPRPISSAQSDPTDEATTSSTPQKYEVEFEVGAHGCAPVACYPVYWTMTMIGIFRENHHAAWWNESKDGPPRCRPWTNINVDLSKETCGWVGANHQPYGGGYHITDQTLFTVTKHFAGYSKTNYKAVTLNLYGDGHVSKPQYTDCICNPNTG